MEQINIESDSEGFDDPLAVEVGLGVGPRDIPPEGWPENFKLGIALRILSYLPEVDEH